MEPHAQRAALTRGQILLLALLGAFVWLLLSLFGNSTAAVADDDPDSAGLLDGVTSTVEAIVPVSVVSESVVDPVIALVAPVIEPVVEPVLEQPVVDRTVKLLSTLVNETAEVLPIADSAALSTLPVAAPMAAASHEPGPAAAKSTVVAPDTRAANVPAAGSLSDSENPATPIAPNPAPVSAPASALGQSSGSPSILAAISGAEYPVVFAVASAAWMNFTLPSSPTFDNDSSPD